MEFKLGLIGYPVQHSLSPFIHQKFMENTSIQGSYQLFETEPHQLEKRLEELKRADISGFNVTVPHKQAIMSYLDEVDSDAYRIGAVNTVVNDKGRLKGYNTDGIGYVRSLAEAYPNVFQQEKKALILGAGGAARGIYRALVKQGIQGISIANRTKSKAEGLLDLQDLHTETEILSFSEAEAALDNFDLIVQTTSVGMSPNHDEQVISLNKVKPHTVVSDIVYKPLNTKLLREAANLGAKTHHGHTMLLYQAQYAFEIWTGAHPQMESLVEQLEQRLRGNGYVNR
ncbi:shikimate dehydrogenase [Sediminibacillus dalangtanensis]|uniref:Shikimate dehydrogenase (NADP(+)) n=1 Tax=Sediminibacillus dalangtanensis TaxID=2729421 RepID=A0ABX7VYX9_9BACI|nr:shikimate dehydrogenase [Sediminibacillus dalangtanensis]QTM99896.1 shikimate dehydrogenase [Sediminibacillus dalangtanensis]